MSHHEIIRAWKDPNYRASLSEAARSTLPANPAGTIDLPEPTLHPAAGAFKGFRFRAGIRAGIVFDYSKLKCSAYGDNLWNSELTLD